MSQIPNFPNDPSPCGQARFGKLGVCQMARGSYCPISKMTPTHMAQHDLGNWEIGNWLGVLVSQMTPAHVAALGKFGSLLKIHISQFPSFPNDRSPSGALLGKLGNGYRYILPNFPFSMFPKDHSPDGPALFGKLENGYRYILLNIPRDPSPDGPAQFEKLGNSYRYIFPNFPISQKTPAQMSQHYLGNWEPSTLNLCSLNF